MKSLLTAMSFLALILFMAVAIATSDAITKKTVQAAAIIDSIAPQGSAPGWSRGQQNLALSYQDCVGRMSKALQAEGYGQDPNSGGNFVAGSKGVHTAVIICGPAPENKMLVQVVVASNGDGGGRERQCLQAQMEQPGASRCGANNDGTSGQSGSCRGPDFFNTTFDWIDNGRALGTINFHRDGSTRVTWINLPHVWRTDSNGDLLVYADGTRWVVRLKYDQSTCSFKGERDRSSQTQDGVHTELKARR